MHEEELIELGLSSNEARIYLALLPVSASTPLRISSRTGLHRAYVYDALERLLEKGAVSEVIIGGRKHFQASPPPRLLEMERLRLERLESAMPFFNKLAKEAGEETKVELHRGSAAIRGLFRDVMSVMKQGEELVGWGIDEEKFLEFEPIALRQYLNFIVRNRIRERLIIESGSATIPEAKTTQYRSLPPKYLGNVNTWVYGNKVAFVILGTPKMGILVEDGRVAGTYRNQFELFWGLAKPVRKARAVAWKKRI